MFSTPFGERSGEEIQEGVPMDDEDVTYTVICRMRSAFWEDPSSLYDDFESANAAFEELVDKMKSDDTIAKVQMFSSDGEFEKEEKSPIL